MPEFELTASPSPEELAVITDGLSAFNTEDVGPSERQTLAVLIRDTDGKVSGGLVRLHRLGLALRADALHSRHAARQWHGRQDPREGGRRSRRPGLPWRLDRYVQPACAQRIQASGL